MIDAAIRNFTATAGQDQTEGIIKVAVLAVGGQGGGVLTDWIVDVAERNGYHAQSTSVPGVAQRTGATIYYVEMMPATEREPVFALMPAPGDVDVLVAAEIMEAGRAITRGFVTPDRTTLIASNHRMYAVSEKIVPGDGRADVDVVLRSAQQASRHFVCFPMDSIAVETRSHISACLLGGLAGSGALPFSKESFEETIRAAGRGVEASLRAFDRAYAAATGEAEATESAPPVSADPQEPVTGPRRMLVRWSALNARIADLPEPVRDIARRGVRKVVDYQDPDYGDDYLDAVERAALADSRAGGASHGFAYARTLAKYLANAMAYDDVIRVADLKVRSARFRRVRDHAGASDGNLLRITEFMHPGAAEICGLMPWRIGAAVEARPGLYRLVDRLVNRGRRIRTDSLLPFLSLYYVGGLRRWRRGTLRHRREKAHWESWIDRAQTALRLDYAFAVEILTCRRLVKGYSDTHARSLSKFDRVLDGADLVAGRPDAADWVRRLREAALADEKGEALDGALATIRSFIDDSVPGATN